MKTHIAYKMLFFAACMFYPSIKSMQIPDDTEVTLLSVEGKKKKFTYDLVKLSETIRHLVEDIGPDQPIPLPNVSTADLVYLEELLPLVAKLHNYQVQYQYYENERQTLEQESRTEKTKQVAESATQEKNNIDEKRKEIQEKLSDPLKTKNEPVSPINPSVIRDKRNAKDIEYLAGFINTVNYLDIQLLLNELYIALAAKIQNSFMPVYNDKTTYLKNPAFADSVIKISIPRVIEVAIVNHIIGELVPKKDDLEYSKKVAELAKVFRELTSMRKQ